MRSTARCSDADAAVAAFLGSHAADDVCRFVTSGRRSGQPHDIEIWFGVLDGRVVLVAGNGPSSDWYRNLVADPAVRVRIADRWLLGRAHPASAGGERAAAGEVMGAKYGWWGGDPSIGLTIDDWTWTVPAVLVDDLAFE
ncbi:MAG: nitroreductase family deazaflavin-dependent oxidoreductase [Acidimicrobiia bacterium]|nr:nitroreductase family deazaflavin-dependent oxidoreductase [Acidimicrobiia bacterium]